ncbi:queuosine precursor transporter [Kordia sp.]|uniref:queuosine precursor transporter n=1 Tax=Kordia sp. TaxID=1965332 RepID=UPI003D2843EF
MKTAPKGYRYFHGVAMLFIAMLLIGNTLAVKIITFWGFSLPAGIICFPIAYIINDALTEVYGYEKTRSVIWWGFLSLALMSFFYYIATILTPAVFWQDQESFSKIFGFAPRIAFASFIAFLVGSFLNSYVMSIMKLKMKGKKLWMRTIGSTIIGEGADSIIFNIIAFAGIFAFNDLITIIVSGFILKTLYEVIATPLTYLFVSWLKKKEEEDKYDVEVNYNPFKVK